jgi:hypothetical protein
MRAACHDIVPALPGLRSFPHTLHGCCYYEAGVAAVCDRAPHGMHWWTEDWLGQPDESHCLSALYSAWEGYGSQLLPIADALLDKDGCMDPVLASALSPKQQRVVLASIMHTADDLVAHLLDRAEWINLGAGASEQVPLPAAAPGATKPKQGDPAGVSGSNGLFWRPPAVAAVLQGLPSAIRPSPTLARALCGLLRRRVYDGVGQLLVEQMHAPDQGLNTVLMAASGVLGRLRKAAADASSGWMEAHWRVGDSRTLEDLDMCV